MLIEFKVSIAGVDYSYSRGEVADIKKNKAIKFCEKGIAKPVKNKSVETQMIDYPKHSGGSWYELSDGSKIQGKENAMKEEKKIQNGGG